MLNSLITSQTRIKLLKKFFLNSNTTAHLRKLETEFGESSNAIRIELNRFENAGLLTSLWAGNKKLYQANLSHPLYNDIHNIILKETGIDQVIEKILNRLGNLLSVYLIGDFAHGRDNSEIDLIIVGKGIDLEYLERKITQVEEMVSRKIKYILIEPDEAKKYKLKLKPEEFFCLWEKNESIMTRV